MNRRGIFFTLMTIVMLSIFLFSTVFYSDFLERENTQKRVETLDDFVFSSEQDLSRLIYVNGYRTIFLIEKNIVETGNYQTSPDPQQIFQESFFNGTFLGQQDVLLSGTNYSSIISQIRGNAASINSNFSLTSPVLNVSQVDPWHVRYRLTGNLYFYDLTGTVSWNRTLDVTSDIPIESFSDPFYVKGTNGKVLNKFVRSPYAFFVSGGDASNLAAHVENSYYIASSSAPSFLRRLSGDFSPDVNGVESLVNLQKLSDQGVSVQQKSVVDYIYFDASNNPASCLVSPSVPGASWLRIDGAHLASYQVSCA